MFQYFLNFRSCSSEIPIKRNSFKYAEASEISSASLRRSCLMPSTFKPNINQNNNLQSQSNGIMDCFDPLHTNDEEEAKVILCSSESIPDILQTLSNGQEANNVMAIYAKVDVKKDKNTYVSCSNVDQNV